MEQNPKKESRKSDGLVWVRAVCFLYLTCNAAIAIKRTRNQPWNVAFVAASYLDLVLLLSCLHFVEKTPEGSPHRGRLKVAVWLLSTVLFTMLSYAVSGLMPLVMKIAIWAMSGSFICVSFYGLFVYDHKCCKPGADAAACMV